MAVSFSQIPPNYKLPGVSIEVDPSQAGTPVNQRFGLLAGHPTSAGTAPANIPIAVGTQANADALFGPGSMLAEMFRVWFALNKTTPLFAVPVPEPAAGVAATGTITATSAPSVAGTVYLYIAGLVVPVAIGSSDTTANVATKIAAAVNGATRLPVTAVAASNVVTLTAKWKGVTSNDIRIEDSVLGFYGGQFLPAGLALTYPANNVLSGGTGTPDFTAAIANIGDVAYKFLALPHTDSGSLALWAGEYGFGDGGRWGPFRQSYGQIWCARRDTYSGHITWGPGNNYPVISCLAVEPQSPSPMWVWSAAYASRAAQALSADPARPLQTLTMDPVLPAPRAFRFNKTQLNALAQNGLAIQGTDVDGTGTNVPQILREQTTYQRNTLGQADNAYELATTLSTLDEVFTRVRLTISSKYPRHKLANDGTRYGAGQAIVTPKTIKGEIISILRALEFEGIVENVEGSKAILVVERSSTDANTVEVLFPPDLINQLRRVNVLAQFRLQIPIGIAA
ncbi:phage tail sheath C-terminal domain-containing protein [Methylobacterium oryzisoli]|uniref:phage tail sheath C-terminal domain-containing protein n=1 Tax=Methylobacterium oryzisoli TaxID=3385502 RepID=UPI0038921B11